MNMLNKTYSSINGDDDKGAAIQSNSGKIICFSFFCLKLL